MARIVLVADDSPTIQKKALGILKGQGFEVETVSNGVAAIKRLAVLHPVVVLADVSMPGRDGYEVCEFVKNSPELSQVPVLLVASDMEPYDGPRGEQVGADGIIKKPFEARDLISMVEKFAEQFEAATVAIRVAPLVSPAKPESTQEFVAFGEEPDDAPTRVQHVEPDFSAHAGGIAFAEPAEEVVDGFSYEPHPVSPDMPIYAPQTDAAIFPESTVETPSAPSEEHSVGAEAPSAPGSLEAPPTADAERGPSLPEEREGTTPEPVFLEEQPARPPEPSYPSFESRTMIFRAPLEIAEPVWKDETVPTASAPVSDGPMAVEQQHEAEAPVASPEIHMEQPSAPTDNPSVVTATSLDSFSLDDAATGQVHFASEGSEVVHGEAGYSTPGEQVSATEIAPPEFSPEVVYSEQIPLEAAPEAVHTGSAPPEVAPEVVYSEQVPLEAAPEAAHTESTPPEVAPEVVYPEQIPVEAAPEAVHTEAAPPEVAPEVVYSELAAPETALEAVHTEIAPPQTAPEIVSTEPIPPEAAPEAIETQVAAPEAVSHAAPPEPVAQVAVPPPALDWDSFYYSIIRKVVVRMSPPVLPAEVVDEIARRLAEEIAAEFSSPSSHSPT
ncbi:MAG TPA: response regulator [Terriglobia bacterium]|nr:response regulator [Terriglobia bacterium]